MTANYLNLLLLFQYLDVKSCVSYAMKNVTTKISQKQQKLFIYGLFMIYLLVPLVLINRKSHHKMYILHKATLLTQLKTLVSSAEKISYISKFYMIFKCFSNHFCSDSSNVSLNLSGIVSIMLFLSHCGFSAFRFFGRNFRCQQSSE